MIGPGALIIVFLASIGVCRLVMLVPLLDRPDGDRKVQTQPVPRTGGLGIGLVTVCAMVGFVPGGVIALASDTGLVALGAYILAAGLIGLLDDVMSLPARVKLFLLAGAAIYAGFSGPELPLALPGGVTLIGISLWLFVMPNALNFMDGANGLALGSAAVMLAGYGALWGLDFGFGPEVSWVYLGAIALITITAILGFLVWNMSGRLYAGDTGALAMGAVIAGLGVLGALEASIWLPATFALPVLVDVFMTLTWRARRGENLLMAHTHHAYQLMIRAGVAHWQVAVFWWGLTALCVIAGLAGAKISVPSSGFDQPSFWIFAGLLAAGCFAWLCHRRGQGLWP